MKQTALAALSILLAVQLLHGVAARGPAFETIPANVSFYENNAELLPSSPADVITGDIWLVELTLSNTTGSDVTCTISDKQGTPAALFNNIVHPGLYIFPFKARKMPGGVTWSCGTAAAVVGSIRGMRLGP